MNTTILIMYMSYKGALEYMPRKFFFHWNLANFISSYTVNKRKIFKFFIRYMHKNINLQTFQYIWAWASNLNHTKKCHEKTDLPWCFNGEHVSLSTGTVAGVTPSPRLSDYTSQLLLSSRSIQDIRRLAEELWQSVPVRDLWRYPTGRQVRP